MITGRLGLIALIQSFIQSEMRGQEVSKTTSPPDLQMIQRSEITLSSATVTVLSGTKEGPLVVYPSSLRCHNEDLEAESREPLPAAYR